MVAISDNDRPIHMEELHEIEAKMLATSPDTQSSANMSEHTAWPLHE